MQEVPTSEPRIGYVSSKYPRPSQTFVVDEILALEARGVDVSIFSLNLPDEGRFHRDLAAVRAPVVYLPAVAPVSAFDAFRKLAALDVAPAALEAAVQFVERNGSTEQATYLLQGVLLAHEAARRGLHHLHAHFMTKAARTTYVAHLLTGIPFSVTAHAHDIYRRRIDSAVFREIASASSCVVTVCDANRRFILDKGLAAAGRVARVYNGIFLEDAAGSPVRDPRLILAVGRLVEKKGFDVLVEAFGILAERRVDFSGVIVGEGVEQEAIRRRLGELGLDRQVRMPGTLPRHEVLALMRQARVLAAPCVAARDGNQDALPTVILEALASDLPVVTSPVGGIPEMIEHGTEGLVVPSGDGRALADALESLLLDEALFQHCSQACRPKAAARFDRHNTVADLLDIFRTSSAPRRMEQVA